jgi:hypothetical protein
MRILKIVPIDKRGNKAPYFFIEVSESARIDEIDLAIKQKSALSNYSNWSFQKIIA